ncbi:MAG: hypothetical protein WA814_03165, partial [Candidatus Baltobacteraceae bacterium]
RPALLVTGGLLAALALAISGVGGAIEYVARVLPAQAAAETGYVYQYSLTYLLRSAGLPANAALLAGQLSYVTLLVVTLWAGGRLALRLGRRELIAYVPAAFSVFGGPYVHMVDLPFAIPLALVFATSLQGRLRQVSAVALCLLAVPWIAVWITKKLFVASLFVVAVLLVRLQVEAVLAIATLGSIAATIYLFELWPPAAFLAVVKERPLPNDLVQEAWRAHVEQLGSGALAWLAVKVPTWTGLGALLGVSLGSLRKRPPEDEP